jgi:thioesterase domain-containing protein
MNMATVKKKFVVHGWSGRGTQLFKIADELVNKGYATVSLTLPDMVNQENEQYYS